MQAVTSAALAVVKYPVVFQPSHRGPAGSVVADSPQDSGAKTHPALKRHPPPGSPERGVSFPATISLAGEEPARLMVLKGC